MALHLRAKTGRRPILVLVVALLMMVGVVAAAGAAPLPKVDVCHNTSGTQGYMPISVSENAYQAHIDHGDQLVGETFLDDTGMGWEFDEDCILDHVYWMNYVYDMSPEALLLGGSAYNNTHVDDAIEAGYAGTLDFTEWATPEWVEFDLRFTNLEDNKEYVVFLDTNGDFGGPWDNLGGFTTDGEGAGTFHYGPLTFAPGTEIHYSFFVNEDGWSVLKTDFNVWYTTH